LHDHRPHAGDDRRHDVRAISDVPGVQTLRADLAAGTVQVTGSADPAAITAAFTAAGYPAVDYTVAPPRDDSTPTRTTRTGGRLVDTFFSTDATDLPEATRPQALELSDGDELLLCPAPVVKRWATARCGCSATTARFPAPR
jgi:copper chaperone CopZ